METKPENPSTAYIQLCCRSTRTDHETNTAFTRSTVLAQHGSVRRWNRTGARSHEYDNKLVFITFDPTHMRTTSIVVMLPWNETANAYSIEVKMPVDDISGPEWFHHPIQ